MLHIGILSDRSARDGTPPILPSTGRGTQADDRLLRHRIIGHYRPQLAAR